MSYIFWGAFFQMEINPKHPCTEWQGRSPAESLVECPAPSLSAATAINPTEPRFQGGTTHGLEEWSSNPSSSKETEAALGEGEAALTHSAQAGGCADRCPSALLPAKTPGWSGNLTFTDPSLLFIATPASRPFDSALFYLSLWNSKHLGLLMTKMLWTHMLWGWIFSSARHKHPVLTWGSWTVNGPL